MRIAGKRLALALLTILLGLLVAFVLGRQAWQELLQDNHIEQFEWQNLSLSAEGLSVGQLEIIQAAPERRMTVNASQVTVDWRVPERPSLHWRDWLPRLTQFSAGAVHLELTAVDDAVPGESPAESQSALPSLDEFFEQWSSWAPSRINVEQFTALLPCASGRCELAGSLVLNSADADSSRKSGSPLPVNARLQLIRDAHQLVVTATLDTAVDDRSNDAANSGFRLVAELSIDDTQHLTLATDYQHRSESGVGRWQGSVSISELPQPGWLLNWLQTWHPMPVEELPAQPESGSLNVHWQLRGPAHNFLAQASGTVSAEARIPQAWPAPGVGNVKGDLALVLKLDQGQWLPETLQADLELSQPEAWINQLPEPLRPQRLSLNVRPASAPTSSPGGGQPALLPLAVTLKAQGNAEITLDSVLAVATAAPWRIQFGKTKLAASLARWDVGDWRITQPQLVLLMTGEMTPTEIDLKFAKPSTVAARQVKAAHSADQQLQLQDLQLTLAGTTLNARLQEAPAKLETLVFAGPLNLRVKQLRHPQLLTQGWRFNGNAKADLKRLQLSGVARANTGTSANVNIRVPYGAAAAQTLRVGAEMRVSGQPEIDGLGRVLANWPELLGASGGTVSASMNAQLAPRQPLALEGKLTFVDVGGTWDGTAWRKLNGSLEAALKNQQLALTTPQLTLEEINPGIPLGPIVLAGDYRTSLQKPMSGQLTLTQANAGAIGGQLNVAPGSWDFAAVPVTVPLELDRLSLAQLLRVYPAEGLAGTGILSGTIPLLVDPATGVRVKRGRVNALKPGGRLQLSAERLRAMGRKNETMELVAKALENFRYSVLDSDIDYDENGTLVLNLHLKGNSPQVDDGRAVILNINIEENIPALLTSLQLSGRVTDAVTERVKKRLRKRERQPETDLIE